MTARLGTAIPLVKSTLLQLMDDAESLAGVQCLYGIGALNGSAEDIHIALGDTAEWDDEEEDIGHRVLTETFSLLTFIRVERMGYSQQEATESASELLQALRELVMSDETSTAFEQLRPDLELVYLNLKRRDLAEIPSPEGFSSVITAVISAQTRI